MKRWQSSKNHFWEAAPFFRFLLPLMVAIICYDKGWLPEIGRGTLLILLFGVVVTSLLIFFVKNRSGIIRSARAILLHLSLFTVGWFACFTSDIRHDSNWFGNHLKTAAAFKAVITEAPAEKASTWKLKVEVQEAIRSGSIASVKGEAFVYLYKNSEPLKFQEGDAIIVSNKWIPIKNSGNPNEFDYARFCSKNNIFLQQFSAQNEVVLFIRQAEEKSFIRRTHLWAMETLHHYVKDTATLGLMQAMLLGDAVNFDPELRQSYVETGIIHIVAISGGHVLIFFQIIALLFFWLRNKRYEFVKYLIAVPLVCFYVAVAGAPTSAVRAAVMFSFLALGMSIQKDRQPLNQLFTTAFFMLLYEPNWLFGVGFQLSFAAVLSLMLFYQPISRWFNPDSIILKKIWQSAAASIAAEVIIAPIIIYYFHLLPVTFLFANVIAYVFMTAILAGGLALILLSKLPALAGILAIALTNVVGFFNQSIAFFQQFNPEAFKRLYLSLPELVLVYLAIAGFAVLFLTRKRSGVFVGLASTCLLFALFIHRKWQTLHQQQFVVYNINKKAYAEIIVQDQYFSVLNDGSIDPGKDYATKEYHIAKRLSPGNSGLSEDLMSVNGKSLLLLRKPIKPDSSFQLNVDYLLICYPVKDFNLTELQQSFHFKELVVTGNQKRYLAQRWKDSCEKNQIPAHFTLFDGAFVMK